MGSHPATSDGSAQGPLLVNGVKSYYIPVIEKNWEIDSRFASMEWEKSDQNTAGFHKEA